jgi:Cft2 family RNA processing exonuclease
MFLYDKGIKIAGSSLWLDASRRVETCCVSHGHLDHAKKHGLTIANRKTVQILQKRIGNVKNIPLEFNESYEFDGVKITLLPAGHILGSAQILIESNGLRLLYTGDFNTVPSATAEPIEITGCDILIMECTFGKPNYRFPAREAVITNLIDFVDSSLREGMSPVVLGYALGKAQEAMKILGDHGYAVSAHSSVAKLTRVYEACGVEFGVWDSFHRDDIKDKVLVFPRHAIKNRTLKRLAKKRMVFLSGWAVNPRLKYRMGIDEALPLSDHADFGALIEFVRKVNPKKVYTTHGFKEFPYYLRALGFDARMINESQQLSLF